MWWNRFRLALMFVQNIYHTKTAECVGETVKEAYSYRSYRLPNYERNCFEMTNVVKLAVWSGWVTGVLSKHFGKRLFDAVLRWLHHDFFIVKCT